MLLYNLSHVSVLVTVLIKPHVEVFQTHVQTGDWWVQFSNNQVIIAFVKRLAFSIFKYSNH